MRDSAAEQLTFADVRPKPRTIEMHLPFPPSVNHIWKYMRGGKVKRSAPYERWIRAADNLAIAFAQLRGVRMITGHFRATLIFSASRRTSVNDADNRIKAVLDWAQSRRLVSNDANCDGGTWEWGEAPHGCRLIITEVQ